jgi:transcriptional regulator with XRE-family HTH domain
MTTPHVRLGKWRTWRGVSIAVLAKEAGVSRPQFSNYIHGRRLPSRRVAVEIERLSSMWPEGPIRVSEWGARATS